MKKLLTLIILFFSANLLVAQDAGAKKVLDAMKQKYESYSAFSASVTQEMLSSKNKVMNSFDAKVTVKKEKYKLEIAEQVIYNNGITVWRHLVEDEEVYISNADKSEDTEDMFQSPSQLYNLYKDGFKYVKNGLETVSGVACDIIELAPIDKKKFTFFKIKLYVSKTDKTLKQWVVFEKDPDTLQIVRYRYKISNFKPNLRLTDQYFTFDKQKYPDVDEIDERY